MCRRGLGAGSLRDDAALGRYWRLRRSSGQPLSEHSRRGVQVAGAVCRCESPASAYGVGWQRTLAKDFKLEHAGVPGRLLAGPNGVKESAINMVADVPLMMACGTHENTVAGPESCEAGEGQRAVLLLG